LTRRPHRRCTWAVQSYSPGCANVHPYLIHASLDPPDPTSQTASRFCRAHDRDRPTDRRTDRPIDHATRSVAIGRIYLCSAAMRANNNKRALNSNRPVLVTQVSTQKARPPTNYYLSIGKPEYLTIFVLYMIKMDINNGF